MERQSHGFTFEKDIINKFNLIPSDNYTSEFDAFYNNTPVQIKLIKHKSSICLGDYFRQLKNDKNFILIVGFWDKNKNNIIHIDKLLINNNVWRSLFKLDCEDFIVNLFEGITNSYDDDLKWKNRLKELKSLLKKETELSCSINPKRDHKNQKRIQCSFSYKKFQKVKELFEEVSFL